MENYDAINDMEREFPENERIGVKVFVPKEEQAQGIKKYLCTLFPYIKEEGITLECRPRKHGNRIYFVRYYDVLIETFVMDETQTQYDAEISLEHKLRISHSALVLNQAREAWGLKGNEQMKCCNCGKEIDMTYYDKNQYVYKLTKRLDSDKIKVYYYCGYRCRSEALKKQEEKAKKSRQAAVEKRRITMEKKKEEKR